MALDSDSNLGKGHQLVLQSKQPQMKGCRRRLEVFYRVLPQKEAKVLRMRFGIDMNLNTLEEVETFDVTGSAFVKLKQALKKLRHPARSDHLKTFLD